METMMSFAVDTEHARRQKTPFVVNTIDNLQLKKTKDMAYTERFKQIEPFVGKMQRAPHAAHLSWMQRHPIATSHP
jgi:hypothetical protein